MSDADGSWPADPSDPRCPACDGPVSATADYCMHCQANLPGADSPAGAGEPAGAGAAVGTAGETTTAGDATTADTVPVAGTPGSADRGWLHPDGLLDDSLTLLVGVLAGAVTGTLASVALVFALPGAWPFLVGVAAWVLSTVAVARSRSVLGAVETAGLVVALPLVAIPLTVSLAAPMADPGDSRLQFAVVLAVFTWPVAGVLVAMGRVVGGRASGEDTG